MAEAPIIIQVTSLVKTCTKIASYIDALKTKIDFAQITIALLSVECSIATWSLSQLEETLLSKPDLLNTVFCFRKETLACLEMGIDGVSAVLSLLDQELHRLRFALSKPDELDSSKKTGYEDRLKELAKQIRDQGSSISFILACVQLNCGTDSEVTGMSSIGKSALRRNYIKTKSIQSTLDAKGTTPAKSPDHVPPSSSNDGKPNSNKPLPRFSPTPQRKSRTNDKTPDDKGKLKTGKARTRLSLEPDHRSIPNPKTNDEAPGDSPKSVRPSAAVNGNGEKEEEPNTSAESLKRKIVTKRSEPEVLTSLQEGIMKDDIDGVRALLREGVDIDCMAPLQPGSANAFSFLATAIESGSSKMVQLVLDYGGEPESIAVPHMGYTALHWATSRNQLDIVKILVQEGSNVMKQTSKFSETALFVACRKKHLELARFLLQNNGIKVIDTPDCDSRTPLLQATLHGWTDIVDILLIAGADIKLKDGEGNTALHIAAKEGHTAIIELLLKHKAQLDAKDSEGETALHVTASHGHTSIALLFMEHGTELDARDSGKKTPLHIAVRDGHISVVELFIQWGADLEAKEEDEWTPLHFSVQNQRHEMNDFLLLSGAVPDAPSNTGRTPLMVAAINDDPVSMKSLLEHGADLSLPQKEGWTAVHFAAKAGSVNALKFLIAEGASMTQTATDGSPPLMIASQHGRIEVVKLLLGEKGVEVDYRGGKKYTPLYISALGGHGFICEVLIEHGAVIESLDEEGKTPLMIAAGKNHVAAIKILLSRGAKIDAQHSSQCALYKAALFGKLDAAKALLEAGALVNNATSRGGTPLHIAAYKGRRAVVELLLRNGADRTLVSTHDNVKGTPVEAARSQGYEEVAEFIEKFDKDAPEVGFIADDSGRVWSAGDSSKLEEVAEKSLAAWLTRMSGAGSSSPNGNVT